MTPKHPVRRGRRRVGAILGALLWAGLAAAQTMSAPPAAAPSIAADVAPATDISIKVTPANMNRQLISVPVNQGVLVDFSVPLREVRVASPEIADVSVLSPRQILVEGKSFGTTQLTALVDGNQERIFTVAVDLDLERLQAAINHAVPRAKVKATGMLDTVVLQGTVPDAESAERIMQIAGIYSEQTINQMRVAGVHQVLLRCTVAEVNRTATRELGFNGWMAGNNFPSMFTVSQIGGINPVDIGAAGNIDVTTRIPFGTAQDGLPLTQSPTLSFGFPDMQMQVFIRALRQNGLLKILAEPNLVAVSGQEASFLAGGEIPYPVAQRDSVTIDYREFGVRLNFTPTVISDGLVRLRVAPEVSEPDFSTSVTIGGFVVPGLTQRRVETVVELATGQTFAIGGLLSEQVRATTDKVPGLGDLPVLGALFSSVKYQQDETELVVLVTPELVEPLNPGQADYVPGSTHTPPNDWELFLLGKLDGAGGAAQVKDETQQPAAPTATPPAPQPLPTALRLRGPVGPAGVGEGL